MYNYRIIMMSTYANEESVIKCRTKEAAWEETKKLAIEKAEIASEEHECEIRIVFNKEEYKITIHYPYDEYCYYQIIEKT